MAIFYQLVKLMAMFTTRFKVHHDDKSDIKRIHKKMGQSSLLSNAPSIVTCCTKQAAGRLSFAVCIEWLRVSRC